MRSCLYILLVVMLGSAVMWVWASTSLLEGTVSSAAVLSGPYLAVWNVIRCRDYVKKTRPAGFETQTFNLVR